MQVQPYQTLPSRLAARAVEVAPGVLLSVAVAAVSVTIGRFVPIVGGALPAVVIGVVIALVRRPTGRVVPGLGYSGSFLLQLAVVLLGAQLSLGVVAEVGAASFPVMIASLAVCLLGAFLLGRALRVDRRLATLIGVGTGICGASAIAAVSPVIAATGAEIAYAVSTIFLFNVLAVVLFPLLGHLLHLDPHAFGLLAGTAVNDTSSVVAAAGVFSTAALGYAVVVKLVRTLMIIPISVGLSVIESRRDAAREPLTLRRVARLVPWFLVGFLLIVAVNSLGAIPDAVRDGMVATSSFLVATALAAIGMSTDVRALRRSGWKPLALGGILWVLVTATTLFTMWATGNLGG